MADLIRISPAPDDGLRRQEADSYIAVDPDAELDLGHFKAMLTLGSLSGMQLSIAENARAAAKALAKAADFLSLAIREWKWRDRKGAAYEAQPGDNPDAFEALSMDEINWMLEAISGLLKEEAASGGI